MLAPYKYGQEQQQAAMRAMGLLNGPGGGMAASMPPPPLPPLAGAVRNLAAPLSDPGRQLQILDHTVHRIDSHTKSNGEEEKEMVVSNLRHFTLKIGVFDPRMGVGRDAEIPLRADLLYENGQPVEQLATCEPLLVGKTEVVAMQGTALFKLRITSLSSHRDKQRFRVRISPTDSSLLLREPGLSIVTTPMKCVTKLSHRSSAKAAADAEDEGEEVDGEQGIDDSGGSASTAGGGAKRKRDDIEPMLEAQAQQLLQLQKTNVQILEQLQSLKELLSRQANGEPQEGTTQPEGGA